LHKFSSLFTQNQLDSYFFFAIIVCLLQFIQILLLFFPIFRLFLFLKSQKVVLQSQLLAQNHAKIIFAPKFFPNFFDLLLQSRYFWVFFVLKT